MNRAFYLAGALVAALLTCSVAGAQVRGGGSFGPSSAARPAPTHVAAVARTTSTTAAPTSGARPSRQPTVIQIAPNGHVSPDTGSFAGSANFGEGFGVPGLGFDYPHLAAVSGNFRNPGIGHGGRHQQNFFTPILYGGYPYYSDTQDYQPVEPQQPQVIVIQQPAPAAAEPAAAAQGNYAEASTPAPSPAPVREVGEFILVRRDGSVFFASAFSMIGNQLQYVTPEGIRRTIPVAELDTVATQQMNEARGTTLQLHN